MIRATIDLEADSITVTMEGFHNCDMARSILHEGMVMVMETLRQEYLEEKDHLSIDDVHATAAQIPQVYVCMAFSTPHPAHLARLRYDVATVTAGEFQRLGIKVETRF